MNNKFKPCLTPNFGVGVNPDWYELLKNPTDWMVSLKVDGMRAELFSDGRALGRSLKPLVAVQLQTMAAEVIKDMKFEGVLEAEIWSEDLTFPEIIHFCKTVDVTSLKTVQKYQKLWNKSQGLESKGWKFPGRTVEFLTTWPKSLKFWVFDAYFEDSHEYTKEQRIKQIDWFPRHEYAPYLIQNTFDSVTTIIEEYNDVVEYGGEGLMLVHKDAPYKFGRLTLNQNWAFKMKDDKIEYEGTIRGVFESTIAREGAEKTTTELGRSRTSQLQEDRVPSGLAGGFHVEMDDGRTLKVSLNGYNNLQKKQLLQDGSRALGQRIKFIGAPPVKESGVPRHAHATKGKMLV